jgi:hypothetical protein
MTNLQRSLVILSGILFATGCQDSPTAPTNFASPHSALGIAIAPDPTLVTFNSASCTLTDASTGAVSCSWDISNPNQTHLNLFTEAILEASYDCVNPHNGRIASSQVRDLLAIRPTADSVASITGSNVALPLPVLPTFYEGSQKKLNACKGNTVVQDLTWRLAYWDVLVASTEGTAARQSCFGSDNRFGCFTL